jgi:hypothetical protein
MTTFATLFDWTSYFHRGMTFPLDSRSYSLESVAPKSWNRSQRVLKALVNSVIQIRTIIEQIVWSRAPGWRNPASPLFC